MSYVMLASHLKGAALKKSFTAAGRMGCFVVVRMRVTADSSGDVTPAETKTNQESKQHRVKASRCSIWMCSMVVLQGFILEIQAGPKRLHCKLAAGLVCRTIYKMHSLHSTYV